MERIFKFKQAVDPNTTVKIAELRCTPNDGITLLAKGSGNFTLRAVQVDTDPEVEFENDSWTVGTAGSTIRVSPGGDLLRFYVDTTTGRDVDVRAFPRRIV